MEKISGEIISTGIAMGMVIADHISVDIDELIKDRISKISYKDISDELDIYVKATDFTREYYASLCKKANEEIASIFEGLSLLAVDEELVEGISSAVKEDLYTAEYAAYKVSRMFMSSLEILEDEYIRQRARDIEEVANKIIMQIIALKDNLSNYSSDNEKKLSLNNDLAHILIVDKLFPEILIGDNLGSIRGIVTKECGDNSHAAIIARTLGIPVLRISADIKVAKGDYVVLDCEKGQLIISPTEDTKASYSRLLETAEDYKDELKRYKDIKVVLADGKTVGVFANVSCLKDIEAAIENGTEGIGLFRTELLYMDREVAPTEEEQFFVYKEAASLMGEKPLIIRTFDGGLDKELKFMEVADADLRGIQLSFRYEELFKTQLRAIYRAAVYGNIKVMFPMIACENEVIRIKEILMEVKTELSDDDLLFKDIEVGIMIETPIAVEKSHILTKDIDFISIGTNDLIQYSFNRDRIKENETKITDEEYEQLFNMIKTTVDNAHKNNCKVSVCGELAGDFRFTNKFIEVGVDELSVVPSKILLLRKQIIG